MKKKTFQNSNVHSFIRNHLKVGGAPFLNSLCFLRARLMQTVFYFLQTRRFLLFTNTPVFTFYKHAGFYFLQARGHYPKYFCFISNQALCYIILNWINWIIRIEEFAAKQIWKVGSRKNAKRLTKKNNEDFCLSFQEFLC